jgi:prepilin-type N-terminal cleavage/methylation domain-containing protein
MIQERDRIDSRRAGIILCPHRLSKPVANRGFSLLELVLVLGIITILAAIAQPRYGAATSRYRADLAARRIVQDLALAQATAKAKGAAQTVRIRQGADQVVLFDTAALDRHLPTYCTYLSDSPYKADITSSVFNGDNYIIFDGWGLPDSGGIAVLSVGSETRTITIDPDTGKASIE